MKKLLLALTLTLSFSALAETNDQKCGKIAEAAETIMTARQAGVDLVKMISLAGDSELMRYLVIDAYDHPQFTGAEYRRKATQNFKDKMFLACLKELN